MRAQPFFSIIIPTLNEEAYLPFLLSDLTHQTLKSFEVFICDGKSKDTTPRLAKDMQQQDKRFHFLSLPKKNVSSQRNVGAKKATGTYLLFIDADTRLPAAFLEHLSHRLKEKPAHAFTTFAIPDSDKLSDKIMKSLDNALSLGSVLIKKPYVFGACLGCTPLAFSQVQGFDENITFQEDANFVQRIVEAKMKFEIYPEPLYIFCMRRYEKEGKMQIILKTLPLTLKSFFQNDFSSNDVEYPMNGGNNYKNKATK